MGFVTLPPVKETTYAVCERCDRRSKAWEGRDQKLPLGWIAIFLAEEEGVDRITVPPFIFCPLCSSGIEFSKRINKGVNH